MTDKERIKQIDTILKLIKTNGSTQAPNIFENNSAIGLLYYSSIDIKQLNKLRKNLISLQKLDKLHQIKTVFGTPTDNRLEKDKPKKPTLKYIDLDSII